MHQRVDFLKVSIVALDGAVEGEKAVQQLFDNIPNVYMNRLVNDTDTGGSLLELDFKFILNLVYFF